MSVARDRHLVSPTLAVSASPLVVCAESLMIYTKALMIFRQGLSRLNPLIHMSRVPPSPALVDAVQSFRRKFNECFEWLVASYTCLCKNHRHLSHSHTHTLTLSLSISLSFFLFFRIILSVLN